MKSKNSIFLPALFSITSLVNAQDKPNIIFIYADDLDADEIAYTSEQYNTWPTFSGVEALGIRNESKAGAPGLYTPNINSIAEQGAVFSRFYITSTVCTPSRYSLMTGRYATRGVDLLERFPAGSHVNLDWSPALLRSETCLAKEMQKLGYRTGIVGKWHNLPAEANLPKITKEQRSPNPTIEEISEYEDIVKSYYQAGMSYLSEGFGWDVVDRMEWGNFIVNLDWMAEGALKFIEESRDETFFLYLPLPVPHGQYRYNYNNLESLDRRVCANGILPEEPGVLPSDEDVFRRLDENGVPRENAMATHMDDYIGAVLQKLDELGLRENTLVIYTSDHGSRGKNSCYEGAARMPFFASWPGKINPGTRNESLCANIDIAATLIDIAGGIPPEDMQTDGRSLMPLLLGNSEPDNWRKSLFLEVGNSRAVVTKRWKYIANRVTPDIARLMAENPQIVYWSGVDHHNYDTENMYPAYWDADQLYDLEKDLYEQNNLYKTNAYCKVIPELKEEMSKYIGDLPHSFGEFGK